MSYDNQQDIVCDFIAEKTFFNLQNLKTLELGPFNGWFTKRLLKYTDDLTVIEYGIGTCELLKQRFNNQIKIVEDDFHYAVVDIGRFDAVVMFGILYHSVSPFKLIEDVVNFCNPAYILLDCGIGGPHGMLPWSIENTREPGSRQFRNRTSGIVLDPSLCSITAAMANLEYQLIDQINLTETELNQISNWTFKQGFNVLVFKNAHSCECA